MGLTFEEKKQTIHFYSDLFIHNLIACNVNDELLKQNTYISISRHFILILS